MSRVDLKVRIRKKEVLIKLVSSKLNYYIIYKICVN